MLFLVWLVPRLTTKYFTGHNLIDNSALKHVSIVQSLEFDVGLDTHLGIREWFSTINLKHNVTCMSWAHTYYYLPKFIISIFNRLSSFSYDVGSVIIGTKEKMIENYIHTPASDGKKCTYEWRALASHKRRGVQKYYFPTKKKVNVLRSFDIITCNENCFKIAQLWWQQHMYAMEITYLLWELLLHCIPIVMSAMGITFF